MSAFFLYSQGFRSRTKDSNPDASFGDIVSPIICLNYIIMTHFIVFELCSIVDMSCLSILQKFRIMPFWRNVSIELWVCVYCVVCQPWLYAVVDSHRDNTTSITSRYHAGDEKTQKKHCIHINNYVDFLNTKSSRMQYKFYRLIEDRCVYVLKKPY